MSRLREPPLLLAEVAVVALLAGCSAWRWSGKADMRRGEDLPSAAFEVGTSSAVRAVPPPPAPLTPQQERALYYSDLGPEEVDVSGYPAQRRHEYAVFAEVCSRCHTLARAINWPTANRRFWELYMLSMRARVRVKGQAPVDKRSARAIVDFLEYDARVRKVERRAEFEARTAILKARFDELVARRMSRLQDQPRSVLPERR